MNAFPQIPAVIPTDRLPSISQEAADFRERTIAVMQIAAHGLRVLAGDLNLAENQTEKALTGEEARSLKEAIFTFFLTMAATLVDETIPLSLVQESAQESSTFKLLDSDSDHPFDAARYN